MSSIDEFRERLRVEDDERKSKNLTTKKRSKEKKKSPQLGGNKKYYADEVAQKQIENYRKQVAYHMQTAREYDIPGERKYKRNRLTGEMEETYTDGRDIGDE